VWPGKPLGVHQHDNLAAPAPERDEALFVVALAGVLARYREVVPDGLTTDEIQLMDLEIGQALSFGPCDRAWSVVTIKSGSNGRSRRGLTPKLSDGRAQ